MLMKKCIHNNLYLDMKTLKTDHNFYRYMFSSINKFFEIVRFSMYFVIYRSRFNISSFCSSLFLFLLTVFKLQNFSCVLRTKSLSLPLIF